MVAYAYIDGFALYQMCFRGARNVGNSHLKWLGVRRLVEATLPDERFERVRYYTARVSDPPDDPARSTRQDIYLQALSTVPGRPRGGRAALGSVAVASGPGFDHTSRMDGRILVTIDTGSAMPHVGHAVGRLR